MSIESIRQRVAAAQQHVDDLCTGKARWTMRVPVAVERDSDTIIAGSLADIELLLAVAEAAKAVMDNPDADEFPDDEWDPRFLTLRAALAALETAP